MDIADLATAAEPFVVCTYGPSGIGKTTDMGYSFPRALFIAAPGALNSIQALCGYTPARKEVTDIGEATELLIAVGKSGQWDTIVIDDFSFLAEQTFSMLEKKKLSGFKLWGELRDMTLEFRNQSRYSGVNVVFNSWEQGPKVRPDGTKVRGGPQLSGKLPEQIPAMCDVVLRAAHDAGRQPHPAVYRCSSDPSYTMKDRFHTAALVDPAPMNLAELLRASGKHVDRHVDLPGQEAEVAAIAGELSGDQAADMPTINTIFRALIENKQPVEVARWTIRDAIDRAVIREAKKCAALYFLVPGRSSMANIKSMTGSKRDGSPARFVPPTPDPIIRSC